MKTTKFPLLSLILTCLLGGFASHGLADDVINLQVAVKSDNDQAKAGKEETHRKSLEITATAFHLAQESVVKLEWFLFGDDQKSGRHVKQGNGSESVSLTQSRSAVAKTKPVAFVFTPRHAERSGSGKRARYKTVEATGIRYHDWAVRAFVGGKLAGEAYSTPVIKKLME